MKRFLSALPSYSHLYATILASSIFLTGCDQATPLKRFDKISEHSISVATINPNGIILGTLENGAFAHTKDTLQASYIWRQPNDSEQSISAVAISKDSNTAITTSGSTLTIWNTTTGAAEHYLSAPAIINALAINDSGTRAVLGLSNRTATIINLKRGGIIQTLPHSSPVLAVAIYNESMVITGEEANKAQLWKIGMDTPLFTQEHLDAVTLVRFAPNATFAFSASRYDTIKGWKTKAPYTNIYQLNGKAMALKAGRRAIDIAFTDNQHFVVAFSDNTIEYRNLKSQQALKQWRAGKKTILAKDNTRPIGIGKFANSWHAIMTDAKLYNLGDL